jgi:hypothetical protein
MFGSIWGVYGKTGMTPLIHVSTTGDGNMNDISLTDCKIHLLNTPGGTVVRIKTSIGGSAVAIDLLAS